MGVNDVIKMLCNGKFKNLKELNIDGIIGSIDPFLMCAAFVCPNLQFFRCRCVTDNRKDFPTNVIRVLFDNLPELKKIQIEWRVGDITDTSNNPIFVHSQLEEMMGNYKNKFEVEISYFDTFIIIT